MITYNHKLNMTPGGIPTRCKLGQYDDDWSIVFSLYSAAGEFTLESGTYAMIRGTKRDGLGYSANCTVNVSNKTVTVTGHKQITAVAGENIFEIVLYKGTKELSSTNVVFYVERAAMDAGTLVSDSQVQEILDMSEDVIAASDNVSGVRGNFAPAYSTSSTYAVGDYVMYSNQMYRCTTAISTAEAWTAAHWTAVSTGGEMVSVKSTLADCVSALAKATKGLGTFANNNTYSDLNTIPINSYACFYSTGATGLANKPRETNISTIQVLTASTGNALGTGTIQVAFIRDSSGYFDTYLRTYTSGSWKAWRNISDTAIASAQEMVSAASATAAADLESAVKSCVHALGLFGNNNTYDDMNTLPANTYACFYGTGATGIAHKPDNSSISMIDVLTISTGSTVANGSLQIAIIRDTSLLYCIYFRMYVSGSWSAWVEINKNIVPITKTVRADGSGNFTNAASAIAWSMANPPTERRPLIIDIGEGTFPLTYAATLVEDSTIDSRGLFLMPYTTIQGRGPDKTILTFEYTGSNDDIMAQVSALNVVYESTLKDLTIKCKNIRYVYHADYALASEGSTEDNEKLKNNTFTMENVVSIHEGFDAGLTPSYKVPAVWGQGIRTNQKRIFRNCTFESYESYAWFAHDRTGITKGSEIEFDGCSFITRRQNGPALRFISWGSGYRHMVNIKNCIASSFLSLGISTAYNTDATIDFYVRASDFDVMVEEDTTNNAHKKENYYIAGMKKCINFCEQTIAKFTPVKIQSYNKAVPLSGGGIFGIATHDAAAGEPINVQIKGCVNIVTSGFSPGDRITYSGGSWVSSATGELVVLGDDVCMIGGYGA